MIYYTFLKQISYLFFHLNYGIDKPYLIFDAVFCNVFLSFCQYLNLLVIAAFTNKSFSDKTSSLVKNSYLLIFRDFAVKILAVCFSISCWALFCSVLPLILFFFAHVFPNILMDYLMTKFYCWLKFRQYSISILDACVFGVQMKYLYTHV